MFKNAECLTALRVFVSSALLLMPPHKGTVLTFWYGARLHLAFDFAVSMICIIYLFIQNSIDTSDL